MDTTHKHTTPFVERAESDSGETGGFSYHVCDENADKISEITTHLSSGVIRCSSAMIPGCTFSRVKVGAITKKKEGGAP